MIRHMSQRRLLIDARGLIHTKSTRLTLLLRFRTLRHLRQLLIALIRWQLLTHFRPTRGIHIRIHHTHHLTPRLLRRSTHMLDTSTMILIRSRCFTIIIPETTIEIISGSQIIRRGIHHTRIISSRRSTIHKSLVIYRRTPTRLTERKHLRLQYIITTVIQRIRNRRHYIKRRLIRRIHPIIRHPTIIQILVELIPHIIVE